MKSSAIAELLTSDSFDENVKILNEKIKELEPLIKAQGGLSKIHQMEVAAKSKAELAQKALLDAQSEAQSLLNNARDESQAILESAQERSEQLTTLANNKNKEADQREAELKRLQSEIKAEKIRVNSILVDLEQREADLMERERIVNLKADLFKQAESVA